MSYSVLFFYSLLLGFIFNPLFNNLMFDYDAYFIFTVISFLYFSTI